MKSWLKSTQFSSPLNKWQTWGGHRSSCQFLSTVVLVFWRGSSLWGRRIQMSLERIDLGWIWLSSWMKSHGAHHLATISGIIYMNKVTYRINNSLDEFQHSARKDIMIFRVDEPEDGFQLKLGREIIWLPYTGFLEPFSSVNRRTWALCHGFRISSFDPSP